MSLQHASHTACTQPELSNKLVDQLCIFGRTDALPIPALTWTLPEASLERWQWGEAHHPLPHAQHERSCTLGLDLTGALALLPPAGQEASGGTDAQPGEPAALQASRKGRKGGPLRRPLIAVCNDLYAPALRPLKAVAKVLQFRPPAADRLVTRLRMICGQEGVDVDKPVGGALPMHGVHGGSEAHAWGSVCNCL